MKTLKKYLLSALLLTALNCGIFAAEQTTNDTYFKPNFGLSLAPFGGFEADFSVIVNHIDFSFLVGYEQLQGGYFSIRNESLIFQCGYNFKPDGFGWKNTLGGEFAVIFQPQTSTAQTFDVFYRGAFHFKNNTELGFTTRFPLCYFYNTDGEKKTYCVFNAPSECFYGGLLATSIDFRIFIHR